MTTLFPVRHEETDRSRESRFKGHADPPLDAAGLQQARELAERLSVHAPFADAHSSPLARAARTAAVAAARFWDRGRGAVFRGASSAGATAIGAG